MIQALQEIVNLGEKYRLSNAGDIKVKNGIYFLFEEGETVLKNQHRIVRIGINETDGRFVQRVGDHFSGNHRGSVFRKHIGRAFLVKSGKESYLPLWDLDNKKVAIQREKIDWLFEETIEKQITNYIELKCSFSIVSFNDQATRMEFEKKLIASIAFQPQNSPSKTWLGIFHPNKKIYASGLWNIQHLRYKNKINQNDLIFLKSNLVK